MQPPTLGDIARALEGDNIELLRPMRELSVDVDAKVHLADYMNNGLRPWVERRVQEQVVAYRVEQGRWQRQQTTVLDTAAAGMEALGIEVNSRDRESLTAQFPDVVDAVALDRREQEVLGPTRQQRRAAELQAQGLATPTPTHQPDEIVETAHRIKELLEAADMHQANIERIDRRIAKLTPEAVDEKYVRFMVTFPGGRIPLPGTDARPEIGADLMRTLARIGITFQR